MYFAFNNEFLNKWNQPEDVEKRRQEEKKKKENEIMKMNMESLEKCINKNAIEELDRTKPYDKTFMCTFFISRTGHNFMNNDEMKEFTKFVEPKINNLGLKFNENTKIKIDKSCMCIEKYIFWSNFIPKNSFTNVGDSMVFRISNNNTTDNTEQKTKNQIKHIQIVCHLIDEDEL